MYIATTSHLNPITKTTNYSSVAGTFSNQVCHLGLEKSSTELRGFLIATLDGFDRLQNLFGFGGNVDVLIAGNETIARKCADLGATSLSKTLAMDDGELWKELLARKKEYTVQFFAYPDDSPELSTLWTYQNPGCGVLSARSR